MTGVSIEAQINEVKREINLRKFVYPKLIAKGKLSKPQADRQIEVLEAVIESLMTLHPQSDLPL